MTQIQTLLRVGLADGLRNALTVFALALLALRLDPFVAVVALALVPPIWGLSLRISRRARETHRASWDAQGRIAGHVAESVGTLALTRAYNAQGIAQRQFETVTDEAYQKSISVGMLRTSASPWFDFIGIVMATFVPLFAWTGWHRIAPETQVSLFITLVLLFKPVQALAWTTQNTAPGLAALDRLMDLLRWPTEPTESHAVLPSETVRSVRLQGIHFSYGSHDVLKGVDFEIKAGERVAIVGASGEGKTTLLYVLMGLVRPQQGRVIFDGHEGIAISQSWKRDQFAWMPQEPTLFSGTLAANIRMGHEGPDLARVKSAGERAQIDAFVSELARGYESLVEEVGANFSTGQKQRICLARVLYRDAPIFVLDEPTSSLDAARERFVLEELVSSRKHALLITTHDRNVVELMDRVVVLEQGHIVEDGAPREALRQSERCKVLLS